MLRQSTFVIPPELEAGLQSGDLTRCGGVVRDSAGRIVKHLDELQPPAKHEDAVARLAAALRQRSFVTGLVGAMAVAGGGAFVAVRRRRGAGAPEYVRDYEVSLRSYLEAVREGRLDEEAIDRLISALDAVVVRSDGHGDGIRLDFSTEQAEMLVDVVVGFTRQLAEANSIDLARLQDATPAPGDGTVVDLRQHLVVQKKIFADAA